MDTWEFPQEKGITIIIESPWVDPKLDGLRFNTVTETVEVGEEWPWGRGETGCVKNRRRVMKGPEIESDRIFPLGYPCKRVFESTSS